MRKHAGVTAMFALLAVAWTWPRGLHLSDAVPGHPGDNYSFIWNLWWMRHVLETPGLAYVHPQYLFYPFGTTIADHPHTALPALAAATLLRSTSVVAAQNLLLIAYIFANMTAMYALVWSIPTGAEAVDDSRPDPGTDPNAGRQRAAAAGRRRRAAIFAAVMFGLSPYIAVHLLGHFDLVAAWVLPLFALFFGRALERRSTREAAAAGVVLGATAYIAYYYVVYLWFLAVVYAGAWSVRLTPGRRPGAASPATAPLRSGFAFVALACAVAAIAIVITGGGVLVVGPLSVSARQPQNALSVLWICAAGWAVSTWRPTVRVHEAFHGALRRATAALGIAGIVFAAVAAPLFWQAARLMARGEYVTPRYFWRSAPHGVDLLAPLAGHPLHPLLHGVSERAYRAMQSDYVEAVAWLGAVPLLLIVAIARRPATARGAAGAARIWSAVAIAFFLWSLGPYLLIGGFDTGLKLPQILGRFLPLVANARMPGRAMVGVYMSLAVLIALAMSGPARLPAWFRRPSVGWLLIALMAVEYWDAPIALTRLDRPAVYEALAHAPPGAVCEVPFGVGDGLSTGVGWQDRRVLYYATVHEHPLVGGYIGRMPLEAVARYGAMPVAAALLQLSDGHALAHADFGAPAPCAYLVVHRLTTSAALHDYIQRLPVDRLAADPDQELYRFR
jgi:hypothetical protein